MMSDLSERNRREHHRAPIHGRCWCEGANVTLYVQMSNVSETGMFIKTATPLQIGSRASVRLVLPNSDDEVEAEGEVVWTRRYREQDSLPPGMGIRFIELREECRERLRQYLSSVPD